MKSTVHDEFMSWVDTQCAGRWNELFDAGKWSKRFKECYSTGEALKSILEILKARPTDGITFMKDTLKEQVGNGIGLVVGEIIPKLEELFQKGLVPCNQKCRLPSKQPLNGLNQSFKKPKAPKNPGGGHKNGLPVLTPL